MTLEELRAQQPELVRQIEASAAQTAVQTERARLQGIDEVATLFDTELVAEAKFGANACDAKELTYRAAQKAAKAGTNFLAAVKKDAKASGAEDVPAAAAPEDGKVGNEDAYAAGAADAKAFFGRKEAK